MEPSTAFQLILLLILLVFSAFFSGSETAFFSLNRWRVMRMIRRGSLGAERVERLRALWYCLSVRAAGPILDQWQP